MAATFGRGPTHQEVASELDASIDDVSEMQPVRQSISSLDSPAAATGDDSAGNRNATALGDLLADDSQYEEAAQKAMTTSEKEWIGRVVSKLPERERHILPQRYGWDGGPVWTLGALAEELSVSREVVRRN